MHFSQSTKKHYFLFLTKYQYFSKYLRIVKHITSGIMKLTTERREPTNAKTKITSKNQKEIRYHRYIKSIL